MGLLPSSSHVFQSGKDEKITTGHISHKKYTIKALRKNELLSTKDVNTIWTR